VSRETSRLSLTEVIEEARKRGACNTAGWFHKRPETAPICLYKQKTEKKYTGFSKDRGKQYPERQYGSISLRTNCARQRLSLTHVKYKLLEQQHGLGRNSYLRDAQKDYSRVYAKVDFRRRCKDERY